MTTSSRRERKAFEYWCERMPETVEALRQTIEQVQGLPVSEDDKRVLTENIRALCMTVATDVDRLHNDAFTRRHEALRSLLGSVLHAAAT